MRYGNVKDYALRLVLSQDRPATDSVLVSLAIVLSGAGVNLLMFVLIARALPEAAFSEFAVWFSALSMLAAIGVGGQGDLIFKNWSDYLHNGKYGLARGALFFGLTVTVLGASAMAVVVAAIQFHSGSPALSVVGMTLFALLFTAIYFVSPATRAISGIAAGDGNMEITWRLITVAFVLIISAMGMSLSTGGVFMIMVIGLTIALTASAIAISSSMPLEALASRPRWDAAVWRKRSLRMWLSDIVANLSLHVDVLIIGLFVDPLLAGGYFVALRVANIFKRFTAAFANFASRRISPLHHSGRLRELRQSLSDLSLVALIAVTGGFLVLVLTADWLLALFGAPYQSELLTLLVLAVGAGVTTLAGPAPHLLLHTGHESPFLILSSAGLVLRCVLLLVLTPLYGTLGAALASTAATLALVVILNIACRRLVHIDPSVVALLVRDRQPLKYAEALDE
ncbi:lipopolysaccharide biosynthesis protein [Hoeflea poritis]|uniref:Polysaccharide biosynthesis C-terminal domain-containing protein n=1 Tax=Hoeflea poritis TaxID=2993659 RepID=A0ABT4VUF1_9HYPH|nr:polysaccharide biosynthesis C-terminal domain-containing protein [Hoeflea poritis]MDA4848346.1 polysaccharide biosynthesis C-terminal domain-containing protein [Hoeflea poritis]